MPEEVNGNSHHGFGLYITTTTNDNYTLSYKGGTVQKTTRGGLYCWTNKYNLSFEDVTVIGNGYQDISVNQSDGTIIGNVDNGHIKIQNPYKIQKWDGNQQKWIYEQPRYAYAYCGFYNNGSQVTYKNVTMRDIYQVEWGGAWASGCWPGANSGVEGITFINCGSK